MDASRFDAVFRIFGQRRLSRRSALASGAALGAAALATAATAQDATPPGDMGTPDAMGTPGASDAATRTEFLFVQSFQAGSIEPKEGVDGRYTLTLEAGLGQTVYFSDRPERLVGTAPTPQFLDGLGFPENNPPNAALVVETGVGETDIAVVELFAPVYDAATHTATYEVEVLANWETSTELGFTQAPSDLAAVAPAFGTAHLFIDGCAQRDVECWTRDSAGVETMHGAIPSTAFGGWCWSLDSLWTCVPCDGPDRWGTANRTWGEYCNKWFTDCNGECYQKGF